MSDRRITMVIMTRNRRDELLETLARMTAPAVPPTCSTPIPGWRRSPPGSWSLPPGRGPDHSGASRLAGAGAAVAAGSRAAQRARRRERRVVPPEVERGLRLLEAPQRHSVARRYVG